MTHHVVRAYDLSMNLPLSPKKMSLGTTWRYSSGSLHAGFDYGVGIGTPIFAVRNGVILAVNDDQPNMASDQEGVSGQEANWVMQGITYKGDLATVLYLHVSPKVPVQKGDRVTAGQQIALSGHNGHSTGPHLHVAVMTKHRFSDPFQYLTGIGAAEGPPTEGVASNGICIFPPSLVYTREPPHPLAKGRVVLSELRFGTMDSDSVRLLQHRLNQIPLDGGVELPVTGNYLQLTRAEVSKWQVQKAGAAPGKAAADGTLSARQAGRLFGRRFTLVPAG